ncbi:MAG: 50S ribosomal protein L20 [Candidatus Schekmanbacteria bacterium]|nr:MAG: 50S ribosomal protein L20 [Candidatus Schekmanbacteria bacterium]
MPRAKGGFKTRRRRKKILKQTKGYWNTKSTAYSVAAEQLIRSLQFSYRDRRRKKRDFRSLWIIRINAAARQNGLTYGRLICGLKKSNIDINRKMLAHIAVNDPEGFSKIAETAKSALQ